MKNTYYSVISIFYTNGQVTSVLGATWMGPVKPGSVSSKAKNCTIYVDWFCSKSEALQHIKFIEEALQNIEFIEEVL